MTCCDLKHGDYEDIESVQAVGLIVAGQVKQKRAGCGGNSLHRCCCFQRQNGELRNANRPDSYHSRFPTRNTIQVSKEEEAVRAFMMFNFIHQTALHVERHRLLKAPPYRYSKPLSSSTVIIFHIATHLSNTWLIQCKTLVSRCSH